MPAGSYKVTNNYTSSVVFGLTQDIVINENRRTGNIINGQSALRAMFGFFEPLEKITIYLSNLAADDMVAPDLMASMTRQGRAVMMMQTPSTRWSTAGGLTRSPCITTWPWDASSKRRGHPADRWRAGLPGQPISILSSSRLARAAGPRAEADRWHDHALGGRLAAAKTQNALAQDFTR